MLSKRIISSSVLIGVIIASIFVEFIFKIAMVAFTIAGLYEFFTMLEKKGISIYKYFGIGVGVIIPLSILFRFELTKRWELLFIALMLLFLIVMQFRKRSTTGAIVDISTTLFGILYVSWLFSFLIKVRYLAGGVGLFAAVLLITKLGDIGAYLIGTCFGKTPLIPRISPKKSVEGSVGGLLFSVSGALVSRPLLNLPYLQVIFIGLVLGILGQLGDLSESLFKRDCEVKDSGVVLPGLGGVLDSMDSLLFSAPVFYFYMSIVLNK